MSPSSYLSSSLPSSIARGVGQAGLALIMLFLTILSASLFPVRLLDAAWQLKIGGALINSSALPLIGLVLLHLAASLDSRDPLLVQGRRLAAQLATVVALGYLLLAPLLATANLQRQQSQTLATTGGLRRAAERLQQMRQVVNSASSIPELEQRLAALEGPRLDGAARSLPLPLLRSRIASLLDQASARIESTRSRLPPTSPWALLGDILRTSVASLTLAAGFAGLAWSPGSQRWLLKELQQGWNNLRFSRANLRRDSGPRAADSDYFRLLSEQAEVEDGHPSGRRR